MWQQAGAMDAGNCRPHLDSTSLGKERNTVLKGSYATLSQPTLAICWNLELELRHLLHGPKEKLLFLLSEKFHSSKYHWTQLGKQKIKGCVSSKHFRTECPSCLSLPLHMGLPAFPVSSHVVVKWLLVVPISWTDSAWWWLFQLSPQLCPTTG